MMYAKYYNKMQIQFFLNNLETLLWINYVVNVPIYLNIIL